MYRTTLLVIALVATLVTAPLVATLAVAQAQETTLTRIDAPERAQAGDTVYVAAWAESSADNGQDLTVKLFRRDTDEKLCERTITVPGTVMCSANLELPADTDELELRATVSLGGRIPDAATHTITITSASDDGSGDPANGEPTDPPDDNNDGSIGTPPTTFPDNSTGTTDPGDDDGGLLDTMIDGITDSGKSALKELLQNVFFHPFNVLVQELVTDLATVLSWTPTVHPNPAVEDLHQLTLRVAIGLALCGFMAAGLLYQVGPLLNVSYQDVRYVLPRLGLALMFATVSLPLLQLVVDLSNALTIAFRPTDLEHSLSGLVGTGTAAILVWVINAGMLLSVAIVYILRDVYILFGAAISPILAIAWALPKTRRYATTFISGWYTAVAMGPLAMLILHFVFVLMQGDGATVGQSISNWLYGVAGFALLLFVPYQLYGASQAIAMQAYSLAGGLQHGAAQKYRQYRQSPPDKLQDMDYLETMEMRQLQQRQQDTHRNHAGYENHGQWDPHHSDRRREDR
ncbi:hypothetical protein [Halomontanus rarus]|uniref:hypothetical protein n=1 Tax=Halomontanus rarus TaxID=3034020 RepID=UPI001A981205